MHHSRNHFNHSMHKFSKHNDHVSGMMNVGETDDGTSSSTFTAQAQKIMRKEFVSFGKRMFTFNIYRIFTHEFNYCTKYFSSTTHNVTLKSCTNSNFLSQAPRVWVRVKRAISSVKRRGDKQRFLRLLRCSESDDGGGFFTHACIPLSFPLFTLLSQLTLIFLRAGAVQIKERNCV